MNKLEIIKGLHSFDFNKTNLAEEWKFWLQKLKIFITAGGLTQDKDEQKIAILLNFIGDQGIKLYNTFKLDKKTSNLKPLLKNLKIILHQRKM